MLLLILSTMCLTLIGLLTLRFNPYEHGETYLFSFIIISIMLSTSVIISNNLKSIKLSFYLLVLIIFYVYVRTVPYYSFETPIGIDPYLHFQFIKYILQTGRIPEFTYYQAFPSMHIMASSLQIITSTNLKNAYFSISATGILLLLFIYLISTKLVDISPKAVVISLVIFSIMEYPMLWYSQAIIPMSLSISIFPMGSYLLLKITTSNRSKYSLLLSVIWILLAFTHPFGALAMIIYSLSISSGLILRNKLFNNKRSDNIKQLTALLVALIIITLAVWVSFDITLSILGNVLRLKLHIPNFKAPKTMTRLQVILSYSSIVVFFVLAGISSTIETKEFMHRKKFATNSLRELYFESVLFFFLIMLPILIIGREALIINRWIIYFEILLLPFISRLFSRIHKKSVISILAIGLLTVNLINPANFLATHVESFPRNALYPAEITSLYFSNYFIPNNLDIYSDPYLIRGARVFTPDIDIKDGSMLLIKNTGTCDRCDKYLITRLEFETPIYIKIPGYIHEAWYWLPRKVIYVKKIICCGYIYSTPKSVIFVGE